MLTGDLSDFSLREILQFLAVSSSSGVCEVRNAESRAGIAFRDGGICLALLDMDGIHGLAARMVHAGGVDVARLRALGSTHTGDAVEMAGVLATETAGHAQAAKVFREHTYETLGWLVRRGQAQFLFERSLQLDAWPFDAVDLEEALDVVDERSAAWDELADTASDLTRICSPVPDTAPGDEVILSAEQWRVLSLVDGRRMLKDVIELSGIGHLETCRQVQQLVEAGLVELVAADESSSLDDILAGLDALRPAGAGSLVTAHRGTSEGQAFERPMSTDDTVVPLHARVADDDHATRRSEIVAPVAAATAPADDRVEVADDVGHGLDSDANRALFDRLIGGPGTGS